jgi:hypothetical protein
MSWRRAVDRALDERNDAPGSVQIEGPDGASADVDVDRAGPIGVRVRRVKLTRSRDVDVVEEAERLADGLRSLPERIAPIEVDPKLGGAVLRSRPDEMRRRGFFEVDVQGPREVEVRRKRITDDGREDDSWDLTRDGLGRMLDELDG